MNEFLIRRIIHSPRGAWAQVALGLALAAPAAGARWALNPVIGGGAPFIAFILVVVIAAVFGGARAGLTSLVALAAASGVIYLGSETGPFALRRWLLGSALFLAAGGVVVWLVMLLRTALARANAAKEAEGLLAAELQHRVKNILAIVQSLASQTFRAADAPEAVRRDFDERLIALAGAHNLMTAAGRGPVALQGLAERTLKPFDPARFRLSGEPAALDPDQAVALSLCLHELATNAVKHGALSTDGGHVELAWRRTTDDGARRVAVEWIERGGPPVAEPTRNGFGARLLRRGLGRPASAGAVLSFDPEGVRWRAQFDAAD